MGVNGLKNNVHIFFKAPDKKFFRRGDLAAKQQEQYWKKYQEKHASQLPQETVRNDLRTICTICTYLIWLINSRAIFF